MKIDESGAGWRPSRIMLASDLSPLSIRALPYAVSLARHFDAHLYLTHVLVDHPESSSATGTAGAPRSAVERRTTAERRLSEIVSSGQMAGLRHSVLLEKGFLWQTMEALIGKHAIDLVVVATRGRKEGKGDFPGSWAELIFRHAECPVITVGPASQSASSHEGKITKILFATDFGRASQHAIRYVCSLAQEYHAALAVLHVIEDPGDQSEKGRAMLHATTRVRLLECLPVGTDQRCKLEFAVRTGDAAREILNLARQENAELIVMGAKAGKDVVAHLPEPTAYTVAAGAPCPVLTTKA